MPKIPIFQFCELLIFGLVATKRSYNVALLVNLPFRKENMEKIDKELLTQVLLVIKLLFLGMKIYKLSPNIQISHFCLQDILEDHFFHAFQSPRF